MQRFVPSWHLAERVEPELHLSSSLVIADTSRSAKATKTQSHRTRAARSTSKTTDVPSPYTATSGLNSLTPFQLVTVSSSSTTYATLSTRSPSIVPQPPATYFGTRVYSHPPSQVTVPQSSTAFNPPIVSVALVCSGMALVALAICVSVYRCSCASAREGEKYHYNTRDSPLFGGSGMNSEKYTAMGSLDSWESMQASLAHGMGRMPPAATYLTAQNSFPSSDSATGIKLSGSGRQVIAQPGHLNGSRCARTAGIGVTNSQRYGSYSSLNESVRGASGEDTKSTSTIPSVTATTNYPSPATPSSPVLPFSHWHHSSQALPRSAPTASPAWKHQNVPVTSRDISRPALQSTTNFSVQSTMSSLNATAKPLHSILKQSGSQSSSIAPADSKMSGRFMMQSENQNAVPSIQQRKGPNLSNHVQRPQRPTQRVRPLNAPSISNPDYLIRRAQLPSTASQSGSSSSLTNDSSGTEGGQPLPRVLDFPLPPNISTSIASSSSMKLTSTDFRDKRRLSVASTAARRSGMLSGSPSGVLASVGDLMMRGFADSDASGEETTDCEDSLVITSTAKRVIVPFSKDVGASRGTTSPRNGDLSGKSSGYTLPDVPIQEPAQIMSPVPSIVVTATSVDSLKSLNRRISRAHMQAGSSAPKVSRTHQDQKPPTSHSLSTSSSNRALNSSRSRFDSDDSADEGVTSSNTTTGLAKRILDRDRKSIMSEGDWSPLSQMAFERAQPDYSSATYSIYNMYRDMLPDDAGFITPPLHMPAHPSVAPLELRNPKDKMKERERDISDMSQHALQATPKTPKAATMSTIYAGYGLSDEYDIGTSFAREVGASLGRIG